jgi:hypothetical protein
METGKELTKAEFIRKIDRVGELTVTVKNIVHQTIFSSIRKNEDGNVVVM